jgi:CcmD family protein
MSLPVLDHNGTFLIVAFVITLVVLGGYAVYLRSRLNGLRRRKASAYSGRNVNTAAPMVTTAQPASNASGASTS